MVSALSRPSSASACFPFGNLFADCDESTTEANAFNAFDVEGDTGDCAFEDIPGKVSEGAVEKAEAGDGDGTPGLVAEKVNGVVTDDSGVAPKPEKPLNPVNFDVVDGSG